MLTSQETQNSKMEKARKSKGWLESEIIDVYLRRVQNELRKELKVCLEVNLRLKQQKCTDRMFGCYKSPSPPNVVKLNPF